MAETGISVSAMPNCHIEEITDDKGKKTGQFKVIRDPLPSHSVMIEQDAYQAYKRYRETTRAMIAESDNQDLDGSYVRLSDKALRIAALVASLENDITNHSSHMDIGSRGCGNVQAQFARVVQPGLDGQEENPFEDILITYLKTLTGRRSQ